jgi:hypothetical protein
MDGQVEALQALMLSARKAIRRLGAGGLIGLVLLLVLLLVFVSPIIALPLAVVLGPLALLLVVVVVIRERTIGRVPALAPDIVWIHAGTLGVQVGDPLLAGPNSQPAWTFSNITLHLRSGQSHAFLVPAADVRSLLERMSQAFPTATIGYSDALLTQFVRDPGSLERKAP